MFKAIKFISFDIQRSCISSSENLHVFHALWGNTLSSFFAKNDFDPWVT